ncbi:MAG TPA: cardiolipin synthase [Cytophagales bacterium]|jgi:cardiolipin synthase|nr:cardiolipin synthase [Cytophagales bacterium]
MDTSAIIINSLIGVYYLLVIILFFRVLLDNKNPLKTQSYLLILVLLPIIGVLIYFFFGVNLRKQKMFSRKAIRDEKLISEWMEVYKKHLINDRQKILDLMKEMWRLPFLFWRNANSPLTENNNVQIYINGEEKFPALIQALKSARHHIHMEYYIIDTGRVWLQIEEILIEKVKSGVEVRIIYDSLGSSSFPDENIARMKDAGIKIFPYNPVIFTRLANRVNFRDHRKTVVIDGSAAFLGGINIADRYDNSLQNNLYWHDIHCRIDGTAVYVLQTLFWLNWSFVSGQSIHAERVYYPENLSKEGDVHCMILNSEPDSDNANIMEAFFEVINAAKQEVLIATPYFIPPESILTALKTTAKSGVKVILLLPKYSDTLFAQAASKTYIDEMLANDIEVHLYERGMIHAKVIVVDNILVSLGTANMDYRSFEYNAEVNAFMYNEKVATRVRNQFMEDLAYSEKLDRKTWRKRPLKQKLLGSVARIVAPLL